MQLSQIPKRLYVLIAIIAFVLFGLYIEFALDTSHMNNFFLFYKEQIIRGLNSQVIIMRLKLLFMWTFDIFCLLIAITILDKSIPLKCVNVLLRIRSYILRQPYIETHQLELVPSENDGSIAPSYSSLDNDTVEQSKKIKKLNEMNKIRQTLFGKQEYDKYFRKHGIPITSDDFKKKLAHKFKDQIPPPVWDYFTLIWTVIREGLPKEYKKGGSRGGKRKSKETGDSSK